MKRKLKNQKSYHLSIRLTEGLQNRLYSYANFHELNYGEIVRELIGTLPEVKPEEGENESDCE